MKYFSFVLLCHHFLTPFSNSGQKMVSQLKGPKGRRRPYHDAYGNKMLPLSNKRWGSNCKKTKTAFPLQFIEFLHSNGVIKWHIGFTARRKKMTTSSTFNGQYNSVDLGWFCWHLTFVDGFVITLGIEYIKDPILIGAFDAEPTIAHIDSLSKSQKDWNILTRSSA